MPDGTSAMTGEVLPPPRRRAGRPKGSKNRITWFRQLKIVETRQEVLALLERAGVENIFNGDALAGLQSIYMNGDLPLHIRMEAMIAAAPYEKPRLAAVAVGGEVKGGFTVVFDEADRRI